MKCDNWERRIGYFRRKKMWKKFTYLDDDRNDKLLHWLLLSLVCWLMLERRLCVYNVGLKVDANREILTVIMMSCYKKVHSCKRHTIVRRAFCFWRFALLFLGLSTHYRESWYFLFQVTIQSHNPVDFCTLQTEIEALVAAVISCLPATRHCLEEFCKVQTTDIILCQIIQFYQNRCPAQSNIISDLKPYWTIRSELTICEGLLLYNNRLV